MVTFHSVVTSWLWRHTTVCRDITTTCVVYTGCTGAVTWINIGAKSELSRSTTFHLTTWKNRQQRHRWKLTRQTATEYSQYPKLLLCTTVISYLLFGLFIGSIILGFCVIDTRWGYLKFMGQGIVCGIGTVQSLLELVCCFIRLRLACIRWLVVMTL